MGAHIHAVAAAGASAVQDLADELDEDCLWLQAQQQQQQQQSPPAQQLQQQPPLGQQQQETQEQDGSMADAIHQTWPLPPPSVSKKAWAHATPLMLQVWWPVLVLLVQRHCAHGHNWPCNRASACSGAVAVVGSCAVQLRSYTPGHLCLIVLSSYCACSGLRPIFQQRIIYDRHAAQAGTYNAAHIIVVATMSLLCLNVLLLLLHRAGVW